MDIERVQKAKTKMDAAKAAEIKAREDLKTAQEQVVELTSQLHGLFDVHQVEIEKYKFEVGLPYDHEKVHG